jgi:hypothetical protein
MTPVVSELASCFVTECSGFIGCWLLWLGRRLDFLPGLGMSGCPARFELRFSGLFEGTNGLGIASGTVRNALHPNNVFKPAATVSTRGVAISSFYSTIGKPAAIRDVLEKKFKVLEYAAKEVHSFSDHSGGSLTTGGIGLTIKLSDRLETVSRLEPKCDEWQRQPNRSAKAGSLQRLVSQREFHTVFGSCFLRSSKTRVFDPSK